VTCHAATDCARHVAGPPRGCGAGHRPARFAPPLRTAISNALRRWFKMNGDRVLTRRSERHLGPAALDRRLCSCQVVGHFRDLEDREQLPLPHPVADINLDLLHISGNLGHHIDFMKRPELRAVSAIECERSSLTTFLTATIVISAPGVTRASTFPVRLQESGARRWSSH